MQRILIANRSEIALRVLNTCEKMGIETVAIYADDDKDFITNTQTTFSVSLGGGALADTYLNKEKIVEIAKEYHCDAIHPGYGFLSENTEFAALCEKNGIKFIGPKSDAILLMGDKSESKKAMEKAGIPLIPGYHGDNQDDSFLLKEAKKIGFPVLIKAAAGGGGKGMRIVQGESDFNEALEAAKREAKNAFGNDHVLVEKFIERPRHIEVQIISDQHGQHFHFFERECSIQRRHQKIIEETPAPNMSEELQLNICGTAVKIAASINYEGAGTVEFILDEDDSFYFLEMNTRLQVEHPITEMVTGFDLVEQQIKVARGEKLEFTQEDIEQYGHSIECRIYAEDPDNDFLPTLGRVLSLGESEVPHRFECAYREGQGINLSYDPMIAKYVTYATTRIDAISDMLQLLNDRPLYGVKNNIGYLGRVLRHPQFISGLVDTNFIKNYGEDLGKDQSKLDVLGSFFTGLGPGKSDGGFRVVKTPIPYNLRIDGEDLNIRVTYKKNGIELQQDEVKRFYAWNTACKSFEDKLRGLYTINFSGELFEIELYPKTGGAAGAAESEYFSPMPGKILKVCVSEGETVDVDTPLVIMEAMKMEHVIKSSIEGRVKTVFFKEGQSVQSDSLLVELDS